MKKYMSRNTSTKGATTRFKMAMILHMPTPVHQGHALLIPSCLRIAGEHLSQRIQGYKGGDHQREGGLSADVLQQELVIRLVHLSACHGSQHEWRILPEMYHFMSHGSQLDRGCCPRCIHGEALLGSSSASSASFLDPVCLCRGFPDILF